MVDNELTVDGQYDYVAGRNEDMDPYRKQPLKQLPNGDYRRNNDVTDNDTTADFHSPVRASKKNYYMDSNAPPTVPRYSTLGGVGGKYLPPNPVKGQSSSSSSGGRLNISDIPVADSASDRSSPNALSPSDEEEDSPQGDQSTLGEIL